MNTARNLAAHLLDLARALWVAATDSTRDPVCPDCRCVQKGER